MTAERKKATNKQTTIQMQSVQVIQFTSGQARDSAADRVKIVHEFCQKTSVYTTK